MENLQSEILFIAKFGGIVFAVSTHYFYVIKPLAIFNERQKQNRHDIDELKKHYEDFTKVKIEHELNNCKKKNSR